MSDQMRKLIKIKDPTPPNFQLIQFRADIVEALFCCAKAEFRDHGATDQHVHILAVVRSLPRELNSYVVTGDQM
uniref:SJCHGC09734 protein n=1 Tax=Schistosoma japonicum TaxID=6182 RepID=Q5BR08_SCHJA|nr:SJCHGC09734 protein [Schistosoma japonicum]